MVDYRKLQVTRFGRWSTERRARQTLDWCQCKQHYFHIKHGANKILEIGPGRGIFAQAALQAGLEYHGLDGDREVIASLPKTAHRHCGKAPVVFAEMFDFLAGRYFDAIVSEAVIEHMASHAEAVAFVKWCYRLLRPGGRLILRFPDIHYHGAVFWDTPDHEWVTSVMRVSTVVSDCGFRIVRCGHSIDAFTGLPLVVIRTLVRMVPTGLLHRCTGHRVGQPSLWTKLRGKIPQGYIVAEKPASAEGVVWRLM